MRNIGSSSFAVKLAASLLLLAFCLPGRLVTAQRTGTDDSSPGFTPLSAGTRNARLDAPVRFASTGTLRELITRIAAQADLSVTFDDSLPGLGARSTLRFDGVPARTAILRALQGSPLRALVSPVGQIVLVRRDVRYAPPTGLRGQVRDATTATPVLGARVDLVGTRFGAYASENGEFFIGRVPPGRYDVRVLRLGFERSRRRFATRTTWWRGCST